MPDDSIYYDSYKEERDLVLEYNQVTLDDAGVVNILGMGIDSLTRAQAVVKVLNMIRDGGVHHIILMHPYKIVRFNANEDMKLIAARSAMKLPSGAGIRWASRMLGTPAKETIPPLSFIMDIVRISEIQNHTIFIIGGRPEVTEQAFFNIKKSFPKIRIVGRHGGYFNEERERSVIEAVRKSEARIVFVGLGFPHEDKWIHRIRNEFKNTVFIGIGGNIEIISGTVKKAPAWFMEKNLEWFYRIISRPWRVGRFVRVMWFYLRVLFKKVFKKK